MAKYYIIIEKHIRPYLGEKRIYEINDRILSRFAENLRSSGGSENKKALSQKSVSDILSVVKNSLRLASSYGRTVNCDFKHICPRMQKREAPVMDESRQKRLVSYLVSDMDCYKFGILLALYTGIRVGELCALKWRDFDFASRVIKVSKTLQRVKDLCGESKAKTKITVTEPKSPSSVRNIPIPGCIYGYAEKMRGEPDRYVVSGKNGGYVEPRTMQNKFFRYTESCGLPRFNFHCLRHTFATRCAEDGFDIKCLSEILGHSNVNITLDRYVHPSFELKRKQMDRLTLL